MRLYFVPFSVFLFTIFLLGCPSNNAVQSGDDAGPPKAAVGATGGEDGNTASSDKQDGGEDHRGDESESGVESVYTDIGFDKCKTKEQQKVDGVPYSSVLECGGVGGYKLELIDVDDRQTVDIVYPDGTKHELRFNKVVSPSFSETGEKAEWRIVRENGKVRPLALIVRYIFTINPAISSDKASYLTVTKITKDQACVTGVVKAVKDQNTKARELADASQDKPCLKEYSWQDDSSDSVNGTG